VNGESRNRNPKEGREKEGAALWIEDCLGMKRPSSGPGGVSRTKSPHETKKKQKRILKKKRRIAICNTGEEIPEKLSYSSSSSQFPEEKEVFFKRGSIQPSVSPHCADLFSLGG